MNLSISVAMKARLAMSAVAAVSLLATSAASAADQAERRCGFSYTLAANGPLSMAVCESDMATLKKLVETDRVDLNAPDPQGYRPLDVAFGRSTVYWQSGFNPAVIRYLAAHGADTNAGSYLAAAAYFGDADVVKILLDAGADANRPNDKGSTPLHAAARCDFRLSADHLAVQVIALLVSRQADINAVDSTGESVLDAVPTPCSYQPELCTAESLQAVAWPTGSCKDTFLLVTKLLKESGR